METKCRIYEDMDSPLLSPDGKRWLFAGGRVSIPVVAGGDGNPVAHPLGPPVVSNFSITVDTLLNQPTRITSFIMDITQSRFVLDRLFNTPGGVTGGAVVYDVIQANDVFTDRDVQYVRPATEFPVVTSPRRAPAVAEVEKYGGKFWFSDEARDRNDQSTFRNEATRLGNTIVRKLNARAIEVLDAAITANGGQSNFVGHNWEAAVPNGNNPTAPALAPMGDFANAQLLADQRELGISYNIALVNPVQLNSLRLFYGGQLEQVLTDNGFDEVYASNRVPIGVAYFVAEGQLGEMRIEQPLGTETWREPGVQRTWVQSSVRPVMFVNNPFAVVKATGL